MVIKNNNIYYVWLGVAIFAVCMATFTFVQAYGENPCSEKIIKSHMVSLHQSYGEAEKEAMFPIIKQYLVKNGVC